MTAWSGDSIQCCLLLLLLLPTLLLAQDNCSHNCKSEANRYYYVRPEGSAETLCPVQPCLTPSQLTEHFSECQRNNSCQTTNTSLALLPGTYTSASNHGSIIPPLKFFSLTGHNEDCNTDSLDTPSIDCNGTWISLMFQHIKCLHVRNCAVFTGHSTTVEVDHVTFHDSLIRLASITAADHSELDYNYTLRSQSYCHLQKQLADINTSVPNSSVLALRNVSFASDYHTACAREHGIQLATIHATDSALDIADCLFTQKAVTHISLLQSTLDTSGMVQFENANTAIMVNHSAIALTGVVKFFNNNFSAIHAFDPHSTILLAGTVEFTNNTADSGGAVALEGGSITIAYNAQVVFQGNNAKTFGGAITSRQHVTIAGSVQFINNSANQGGAIASTGSVTIAYNAQVVLHGNHAKQIGGAIGSGQNVTIAGSVQFINNSAYQGGAIDCNGNVIIANNAQLVFQGKHTRNSGGAIVSSQHVTLAGSVQFINNSANHRSGGAIFSKDKVIIADNAHVCFQGNHARINGGAISSRQHVTIADSVQFINNSAYQGGAIATDGTVTIASNAQVVLQGNYAKINGGAIGSLQHVTIAGSVQFINNIADQGGAIDSDGNVTMTYNAQVVLEGNHAKTSGGAITSVQHVTIAGSVQFINNSADQLQGGAIDAGGNVTIADNAQVVFQGNHAKTYGGAIVSFQYVTIAGSVQFNNNSAERGGAIASTDSVTMANNALVVFQANHADVVGGAIVLNSNIVLAGSVQFISNTAQLGGAICMFPGHMKVANNAHVTFQGNHAYRVGGAIYSIVLVLALLYTLWCQVNRA